MKKINLSQDSDEWLSWRRTSVTASDCAVIMDVNPYCDIDTLRLRKLGLLAEEPCNKYMQRGKDLEPVARKTWMEGTVKYVEPAVVESTEYPYLGASLDGISSCDTYLLEVKCNGAKNHAIAKKGELPPYHLAQVQHQLLVTGAEKCYYFSYTGENNACVEVYPDKEFFKLYIPKAEEFWLSLIFYKE